MVHGGDAHNAWRMYRRRCPATAGAVHVVKTYHTSRQALRHPDPTARQKREDKLRAAFAAAAAAPYPNRASAAELTLPVGADLPSLDENAAPCAVRTDIAAENGNRPFGCRETPSLTAH